MDDIPTRCTECSHPIDPNGDGLCDACRGMLRQLEQLDKETAKKESAHD